MKKFRYCIIMVAAGVMYFSCKKDTTSLGLPSNSASLTVVNGVFGSNALVTNFTGNSESKDVTDTFMWYSNAAQIGYGQFLEFSSFDGAQPLALSYISDTTQSIWNGTLNLPAGSIHSLYLMGSDTLTVDTLLTTDNPPAYTITDSVMGVRFINLVTGLDSVSVDVEANAGTPLVTNLTYKIVTPFFTLPVNSKNPVPDYYVFEFRNMSSGNVLASYLYSRPILYKNISVVLSGHATGSLKAFLVRDY